MLFPRREDTTNYIGGSLQYLPYVNQNTAIGLHESALYDVPEYIPGIETAIVDATGFNITCSQANDVRVALFGDSNTTYNISRASPSLNLLAYRLPDLGKP
jgi:hypothetical protein